MGITLRGLTRTLTITKNPITTLTLKWSAQKNKITFRNGFSFRLTWSQFRTLRDNYALIKRCPIEQVEDDLFKIKNDKSDIRCSSRLMPLFCDLLQKYEVEQLEDDLYRIRSDKLDLVGSIHMLGALREQENGEYDFDVKDKIVLDVGGFQGESAAYFSAMGAKKVIIYEPVVAHQNIIKRNVFLNRVNAEIHEEGIGGQDGIMKVSYAEIDTSLGRPSKGQREMEIKIRDVSKVIEESGANVAKFDCEGAEEALVQVPNEILRNIESYIIEVHTRIIRRAILEKFKASDFRLENETKKDSQLSVVFLRRNDTTKT